MLQTQKFDNLYTFFSIKISVTIIPKHLILLAINPHIKPGTSLQGAVSYQGDSRLWWNRCHPNPYFIMLVFPPGTFLIPYFISLLFPWMYLTTLTSSAVSPTITSSVCCFLIPYFIVLMFPSRYLLHPLLPQSAVSSSLTSKSTVSSSLTSSYRCFLECLPNPYFITLLFPWMFLTNPYFIRHVFPWIPYKPLLHQSAVSLNVSSSSPPSSCCCFLSPDFIMPLCPCRFLPNPYFIMLLFPWMYLTNPYFIGVLFPSRCLPHPLLHHVDIVWDPPAVHGDRRWTVHSARTHRGAAETLPLLPR